MKTEHTPGPWNVRPVFGKEGRAIFVTDESKPGRWQRRVDDKTGVFSAADARLIAAAPELLDALRGLFEHCVMVHKHWGEGCNQKQADAAQEAARAVLAKVQP